MKSCNNCGNRCSDDAVFCNLCGATFGSAGRTLDKVNVEDEGVKLRRRKNAGQIKINSIVVLSLCALALIMLIVSVATLNSELLKAGLDNPDSEVGALIVMLLGYIVASMIECVIAIIFAGLSVLFANGLQNRASAPFAEVSPASTKSLIFTILMGVFLLAAISTVASAVVAISTISMLSLIPDANAVIDEALLVGMGTTIGISVIAMLATIAAVPSAIIALVKSIICRVQTKRPR